MARPESAQASSYPSPKRQRLSSPTYDEQCSLSQEDLEAFDAFEVQLSQTSQTRPPPSQRIPSGEKRKRISEIELALKDARKEQYDVPGEHDSCPRPAAKPCSEKTFSGFRSAAHLSRFDANDAAGNTPPATLAPFNLSHDDEGNFPVTPCKKTVSSFHSLKVAQEGGVEINDVRSSPPDTRSEQDLLSPWLISAPAAEGALGFQSARSLQILGDTDDSFQFGGGSGMALPGFVSSRNVSRNPAESVETIEDIPMAVPKSSLSSYTTGLRLSHLAGKTDKGKEKQRDWTVPSDEAYARARLLLSKWQQEEDTLDDPVEAEEYGAVSPLVDSPSRPALRAVENSFRSGLPPDSPTPLGIGLSSASLLGGNLTITAKNKPFKSPLMTRKHGKVESGGKNYVASPLNPNRSSGDIPTSRLPPPAFVPLRPTSAAFKPPIKALGLTARRLGTGSVLPKPKFVTPFKPGMTGMKPSEGGRELGQVKKTVTSDSSVEGRQNVKARTALQISDKGRQRAQFFDLSKYSVRQTLATSGLLPQSYDQKALSAMNINTEELAQMTPDMAIYYSFHSSSSTQLASQLECGIFGPDAALKELHHRGCTLATKDWVDNHWGLILWKLAGMVCLQPEMERDPTTRRWCWGELIRQFLYRYERELNNGSRPPLRLITTHDAPASCPMVLCVSKITWHPGGIDEHGVPAQSHPELEVTDGWYRLRASADEPLRRAMRSGHIRVGRKVAVSSARLVSERKEPAEVLEAYDSMSLQIFGNSSHLASWHAKLGFTRSPAVCTLDSLTADGGVVSLMDLTVTKAYPVAYIEFVEHDGAKRSVGPMDESEEAIAQDKWQRQREAAASKLQKEFDNQMRRCADIAEKFRERAGSRWTPSDDATAPADTDDRLMDLLDNTSSCAEVCSKMSSDAAGWLALYAREHMSKAREQSHIDIQKELDIDFPQRNVRSFRVLIVKDSRWIKREPFRNAQLTVWDVLHITHSEGGKPGDFRAGQRFLVTNLYPIKASAWMAPRVGAEVFLATRRDTRFTQIRK